MSGAGGTGDAGGTEGNEGVGARLVTGGGLNESQEEEDKAGVEAKRWAAIGKVKLHAPARDSLVK